MHTSQTPAAPTPSGEQIRHEQDDTRGPKILELRAHWGHLLLDVYALPRDKGAFTLGESGAHLFIPESALPMAPFPLIQSKDGQYHLAFTPDFEGHVVVAGAPIPLQRFIETDEASPTDDWGIYTLPLQDNQAFELTFGEDVITGAFVHPTKALPLGVEVDIPFASVITTLTTLVAMAILLLLRIPPPPEPSLTELSRPIATILRSQPTPPPAKARPAPPPKPEPPQIEAPTPEPDQGEVAKRDRAMETARGSRDELEARKRDKKIAESSGLLGALEALDRNDEMVALFGGDGLGNDVAKAADGLRHNLIAAVGPGSRRTGSGPGGGSEGIAGIATRGGGPGGNGDGYGEDAGFDGQKTEASLDISGGGAMVIGQAIDPSLIDKAIRDHVAQIRYCYSRELNKNPRLFGKVSVKFVIGGTGRVTSSTIKSSTLGNAAVDNCVADRISRIQFPHPKGGVKVTVVYPFNFNAAG